MGLTKRPNNYFSSPQNWNSYSYTVNNPINLTDPTGECWDTCTDAWFTIYDSAKLLYHEAFAAYNQYMANNTSDQSKKSEYQEAANSHQDKAKEAVTDVWLDEAALAVPWVSAWTVKALKTAAKVTDKTNDVKETYTLSKHVLNNAKTVEWRNIPAMVINDTIKNWQKIIEWVKKWTVEYISTWHNINGSNVNLRVVVNPETKKVITVIPTSKPTIRPTTN